MLNTLPNKMILFKPALVSKADLMKSSISASPGIGIINVPMQGPLNFIWQNDISFISPLTTNEVRIVLDIFMEREYNAPDSSEESVLTLSRLTLNLDPDGMGRHERSDPGIGGTPVSSGFA